MRVASIDAATARFLARHECQAHALARREYRDLGDAALVHDPNDREPFWNHLAAVAWPSDGAAFDRRLAEALAMFAALDRAPNVWTLPGFDEPADLVARLVANGFVDMGGGLTMVLDPADFQPGSLDPRGATPGQRLPAAGVTVERASLLDGAAGRDLANEAAMVLGEAFEVELGRAALIADETIASLADPAFHVCLVRVDGEPAAVARRYTFDGASYLSSIGTRPSFQGRGLGRLVTRIVTEDAIAAGSRWVHLGVYTDNLVARRLYESLGFAVMGGVAPDLLLRG